MSFQLSAIVCGLMLLGASRLTEAQSPFTLDWKQIPIEPEKGCEFFMALNPAVNNSISNPNPVDLSVVKMNIPPCAVRTMHIHRNTDELHYILSGSFLASLALPNGTVIFDTVSAGQSFVAPANYVHELSNPSCTDTATFMGFYNHYDAANNNIAAAAYNMRGGPFKAYADPEYYPSLDKAIGIFAYDPICLARCDLGELGGQQPADPAWYQEDSPQQ